MGKHPKLLSPGEVDHRIVRALEKKEAAKSDSTARR